MKNRYSQLLRLMGLVTGLLMGRANTVWAQTPITFRIAPNPACPGETVRFSLTNAVDASQPIGLPGDSIDWHFGASSLAHKARTSISVSEFGVSYAWAGTYPFTVQLMRQGRMVRAWYGGVIIQAGPTVQLGPDTTVCLPIAVRLAPRNALPAGSTLRWPDGSTRPSFLVTAPGTYWLEVISPGLMCSTRVPRVIRAGTDCTPIGGPGNPSGPGGPKGPSGPGSTNWPAMGLISNVITANGDGQNDYFVLQGLVAAEWCLQVFNRWGRQVFEQAQYDNTWAAQGQAPGRYYHLLRHTPSGQFRRGWLEVLR